MVTQQQIERSKAVQRRTGRTFHLATRFLPERARYPTYVLYAFFRTADDVVDDRDPAPPDEQRRRLRRLRAAALGERETDDPVVAAFADLRARHDIPRAAVETFVRSMLLDIDKDRYRTREELSTYLRGSSAAVGHMMLEVMEPERKGSARPHAGALGEAFQLTNFVRDVREDVLEYDRVYLPAETLAANGAGHENVVELEFSEGVADAVREELVRAERLYRYGVDGIRYLPEDCQFPVLAAAVLYADHHRLVRDLDYGVLSTRPSLTLPRRLGLIARARFWWQFSDDPLSVFDRVTDFEVPDSGVDTDDGRSHPTYANDVPVRSD